MTNDLPSPLPTCSDSGPLSPAFIALGSNLGDRQGQLDRALCLIDQIPDTFLTATSRVVVSSPWGDTDQEEFLNAACLVQTGLSARELLHHLQDIEKKLGKKVIRKWGPRVIDLDLLDFGGQIIDSEDLQIPHPRASDRPFVMIPIEDIERLTGVRSPFRRTADCESMLHETWLLEPAPASGLWNSSFDDPLYQEAWNSLEDTRRFAGMLAGRIRKGDCLILDGDLGAGKTTFTAHLCNALGVSDSVSSPSYALCQEYESSRGTVFHWDFYRLQEADDLDSTGFHDQESRTGITIIEWGSLFAEELPAQSIQMKIKRFPDSEQRVVTVEFPRGRNLYLRQGIRNSGRCHEYSRT